MKPDPFRLQLSAYPVRVEAPVRYSDLDPQNHINNVAFGNFYEEGRNMLLRTVFERGRFDRSYARMVVAHGAMSYLKEGSYPGVVTVGAGVGQIGRSSFVMAEAMFQHGVCIGVADYTIVLTSEHGSRPIPDDMRAALQPLRLVLVPAALAASAPA